MLAAFVVSRWTSITSVWSLWDTWRNVDIARQSSTRAWRILCSRFKNVCNCWLVTRSFICRFSTTFNVNATWTLLSSSETIFFLLLLWVLELTHISCDARASRRVDEICDCDIDFASWIVSYWYTIILIICDTHIDTHIMMLMIMLMIVTLCVFVDLRIIT